VRWCDWLSLVLCWRRVPQVGEHVDLGRGPDGEAYQLSRGSGDTIMIEPWPFDVASFVVSVESRRLASRAFPDSAALTAALQAAPIQVRSWELAR
jgi:hypothetical protein